MPVKSFKDVLPIDVEQLDVEWAIQPEIYYHYARKAKLAALEFEKAQAKLELIEAQLAQQVRSDPAAYGLAKATESAVKDIVKTLPQYREQLDTVLHLKYKAKLMDVIVEALRQRKDALNNLVKLLQMEYFAPNTPDGVEPIVRKRLAEARQRIEDLLANDKVKRKLQKEN